MAKKIYCNMCGKPFDIFDRANDFSIDRFAGYGSVHDGEHLRLDLCCNCMDAIIGSCKIAPVERDEKAHHVFEETNGKAVDGVEIETDFGDDCIDKTVDIADQIIQAFIDSCGLIPRRVSVKKMSKEDITR